MSLVNLVVRERGRICGTCLHWRQLLELFNNRLKGIRQFMHNKQVNIRPYDAGLVVIDFDSRVIFSSHLCFRKEDIRKEAQDFYSLYFSFVDYTLEGASVMKHDLTFAGFNIDHSLW